MSILTTPAVPKPRRRSRLNRANEISGILFALPAILGFLILVLGPMIASLFFSFTDYTVFSSAKFIGLGNYAKLFSGEDPFFYKSLLVTLYFAALNVPASIVASLIMAMLLSRNIRGRAIFRSIFYIPSIVPSVASAFIWLWLLNPDLGLVNTLLSSLGLPTSQWFFAQDSVIPSLVLTGLWGTGGTMVIFLAGIEGIPTEYYEAIDVDGGNFWHKFRHITLPMLSPTIFFNAVMATIGSFQTFTQAYIITQGGPNNSSLFIVYYLWREAFANANMGFASAIAWVLFLVILSLTFLIFRSSNSWVYYEGDKKS